MGDKDDPVVLAEGRHLRFVRRHGWEYVERPRVTGIAVVVALTPEGRLLLVEQFRRAVCAPVLELPAGLAGDVAGGEDEALEVAAVRELVEETGWQADQMEVLSAGPPSAGTSSEIVTFFRAHGLRRTGPGGGEGGEEITVHEIDLARALPWLEERRRAGALVDPKVYAGLFFLGVPFAPA